MLHWFSKQHPGWILTVGVIFRSTMRHTRKGEYDATSATQSVCTLHALCLCQGCERLDAATPGPSARSNKALPTVATCSVVLMR